MKIDKFILSLFLAIIMAFLLPKGAQFLHLKQITEIGIGMIFFFYGLKLSFKEVLTIFFIAKKVNKAILILMILSDSDFMKYLFVEKLKELLSKFDSDIENLVISYGDERIGDIKHSLASIDKAKKLLNWEPNISFEEGVKIMLDNINYWKDAPVWNKESIEKATKDWFKYLSND